MINKQQMRTDYRLLREGLDPSVRADFNSRVFKNLRQVLASLSGVKIIAGYSYMHGEIDLADFSQELQKSGYLLALPVVCKAFNPLKFCALTKDTILHTTKYNIIEPVYSSALEVAPDIILTPLIACDRTGNRLGFGKAFYDITISHLRALKPIVAIGLAYHFQVADFIPSEPHDAQLDIIVTNHGAIYPPRV